MDSVTYTILRCAFSVYSGVMIGQSRSGPTSSRQSAPWRTPILTKLLWRSREVSCDAGIGSMRKKQKGWNAPKRKFHGEKMLLPILADGTGLSASSLGLRIPGKSPGVVLDGTEPRDAQTTPSRRPLPYAQITCRPEIWAGALPRAPGSSVVAAGLPPPSSRPIRALVVCEPAVLNVGHLCACGMGG